MVWRICILLLALKIFSAPCQASPAEPAYQRKAEQVEADYRAYAQELARIYDELLDRTRKESPTLYAKLKGEPPRPARHGYQLLPPILPDPPDVATAPDARVRATPSAYSWNWTDELIRAERAKVDELESRIKGSTGKSRQDARLVDDYLSLEPRQGWLGSHVQYNRFWQAEVRKDRPRFDRLTRVYDEVMRRQELLDALGLQGAAFRKRALELLSPETNKVPSVSNLGPEALRGDLQERARALSREIHSGEEGFSKPAYLTLRHPAPRRWVVEVPVYTDIRDEAFLTRLRKIVETRWSARDGGKVYAVHLRLIRISPEKLYAPGKPLEDGAEVNLDAHVAKFPKDGAVITTGAASTYAIPGRFVALGAAPIEENVLAHEFGHLLGFTDTYIRAYHDLGDAGLEILEIMPDPQDIMCAPGRGHVLPEHFEELIGVENPSAVP